MPEPSEVKVHPERAPCDPLQPEGVNATLADRVAAGADEEGRPFLGVEADVADLADDALFHQVSCIIGVSLRGVLVPFSEVLVCWRGSFSHSFRLSTAH